MPPSTTAPQLGLPRPGRVLTAVLVILFSVWLSFALALNWANVPESIFLLFCGNTRLILEGELWRFVTAPLVHVASGSIGHILSAVLGLYFLGTALEETWGGARFLRFLLASTFFAYGVQLVFEVLLPASLSAKLVGDYWFGAMPAVEATAIAWALSFRNSTVRLAFVLPISSRGLVVVVVALSLMYLIAGAMPPSGHIAVFSGMGAGWLFGGGTPSPLRRFYLKLRLRQLDRETMTARQRNQERAKAAGFEVLKGGAGSKPKPQQKNDKWLN